jgi:transcriptional regulator with XRE-family HTH domain
MKTSPAGIVAYNDDGSTTYRMTRLRLRTMTVEIPDYQIASACGMSPITFSRYCSGARTPTPPNLASLCEVFDCLPEDLLGFVEFTV